MKRVERSTQRLGAPTSMETSHCSFWVADCSAVLTSTGSSRIESVFHNDLSDKQQAESGYEKQTSTSA